MVDRNVSITQSVSKSVSVQQSVTRAVSVDAEVDAAVSPYVDLLDPSPTFFLPLKYESTAADGQILYQDSGVSTTVDTAGDPVGGVVWESSTVATQATDAKRPVWQGDSSGTIFDADNDTLIVASADAPTPGTGSFTIYGWFEMTQAQIDADAVSTLLSRESGTNRYLLRARGNQQNLRAFVGDGTNGADRVSGGTLDAGYHFFAVRVDRSVEELEVFLDMQSDLTADTSAVGSISPGVDLGIGSREPAFTSDYHNGAIDVVAYVPSALSDATLTTIYNAGRP